MSDNQKIKLLSVTELLAAMYLLAFAGMMEGTLLALFTVCYIKYVIGVLKK